MKRGKILPIIFIAMLLLSGCTEQEKAKSFGGNVVIELEPGLKLEEITWKDDDSLWYLTRPMREDETAETHTFNESSSFHMFEGTVTIIEKEN